MACFTSYHFAVQSEDLTPLEDDNTVLSAVFTNNIEEGQAVLVMVPDTYNVRSLYEHVQAFRRYMMNPSLKVSPDAWAQSLQDGVSDAVEPGTVSDTVVLDEVIRPLDVENLSEKDREMK